MGVSHRFAKIYKMFTRLLLRCPSGKERIMDAIYLLILAGLYALTHGLVLALVRLGGR